MFIFCCVPYLIAFRTEYMYSRLEVNGNLLVPPAIFTVVESMWLCKIGYYLFFYCSVRRPFCWTPKKFGWTRRKVDDFSTHIIIICFPFRLRKMEKIRPCMLGNIVLRYFSIMSSFIRIVIIFGRAYSISSPPNLWMSFCEKPKT